MRATETDGTIGAKIKAARLGVGLSQASVAERMTMLGHSMKQQTILKIEQGTRPLSVAELLSLRVVLARELTDLLP